MTTQPQNDDFPVSEKMDISHVEALRKEQSLQLEIDAETDRRLNRKIDLHIIPWLFGIW